MNRWVKAMAVLAALAASAGCGGDKTEPAKDEDAPRVLTHELSEMRREDYVPPSRAYSGISPAVADTLRQMKKRFGITRDEYWTLRGGVLANDFIEVWYPAGQVTVTHAMHVFELMVPARKKVRDFFGTAPEERLTVRCVADLKEYKTRTNREWWYYAEVKNDTMTFQPIFVLVKRGLDSLAVSHEYYQWAVRKISRGGAPRWMEEGVASYLSGEGDLLRRQILEFAGRGDRMSPDRVELILDTEETKEDSRIAYYHAFRMVNRLVDAYGEPALRKVITLLGEGNTLDDAFRGAFNVGYRDAVAAASAETGKL